MDCLDRYNRPERRFCIPKELIRDLVVNGTWPTLINMSVTEGTIVTFFAGNYTIEFQVATCNGFPSVRKALELVSGGFGRLVCSAKTVAEGLVAFYRVALHKCPSTGQALQEVIATDETAAALKWDTLLADSRDVMFVWQGEVVNVAELPGVEGKLLPTLFYAQYDDPRPGIMVIGMNFRDPSDLQHPDGLRMNLLQQDAPFTHVWGISQQSYKDSATWLKMDIRAGQGWRNASTKRRILHTVIGTICPYWIPGAYLSSGCLGLGYGNKLFEITFKNFFLPGKQKVFIMPNDSRHAFEEMARRYYSKNPSSHVKLVPLTPDEVHLLNPLFRSTYNAQKRSEYEQTLAKEWSSRPAVEALTGLDLKYPYILLYAGFDESVPNELEAVVSFLGRICRKKGEVPRLPNDSISEVGDSPHKETVSLRSTFQNFPSETSSSTLLASDPTASSSDSTALEQGLFLSTLGLYHPADINKQPESVVSSSSYKAQVCFNLLGETVEHLPPNYSLKQIFHVLNMTSLKPLDPWTWNLDLLLLCPVPIQVFIREYKAGRYVLQVGKEKQGVFFMVVWDQLLADPEEGVWRQLTEDSFTLLCVTSVIYGIELQKKDS